MPPPHPDAIADCVLTAFHALPSRCKPRRLEGGRREWVPLAGIVLSSNPASSPPTTSTSPSAAAGIGPGSGLTCAALATGMKCLPHAKLPLAKGNVVHDWHAEVLAIRAFNRWLVEECANLARRGSSGEGGWVRWRGAGERDGEGVEGGEEAGGREQGSGSGHDHSTEEVEVRQEELQDERYESQPFALRDDVGIHMYCSATPCGDASMELTMSSQPDSTPWTSQPPADEMLGRGNFDRLGVVRRKPSRPDAPATLSKSCSDKLALKQCTSLLSGVVSLLVHPGNLYLSTLVLPEGECVPTAIDRAFGAEGRMKDVAGKEWEGGYSFKPFEVKTTSRAFEYSKRSSSAAASAAAGVEAVTSNLSTLSMPGRQPEVLINGVQQGRKQLDPKGASCVSRRKILDGVREGAEMVPAPGIAAVREGKSYAELKDCKQLRARREVKRELWEKALRGWKRNAGDEDWTLG